MKIKRIEFIPGAGVSITAQKTRTLYDAQGNPVEIDAGEEPSAIGINDFAADPRNPTPAEITLGKQKISERLQTLLVESDAVLLAENARLTARAQAAEQAKQAIETELQTERAARRLAESQKDAALAELQRNRV